MIYVYIKGGFINRTLRARLRSYHSNSSIFGKATCLAWIYSEKLDKMLLLKLIQVIPISLRPSVRVRREQE